MRLVFPKMRLVSLSHPADVLGALRVPETLQSAVVVIIFLSAESQVCKWRNSKMRPATLSKELVMKYQY